MTPSERTSPIKRPMTIPIEYSGLWIAMNRDRSAILDSDADLDVLIARLGPPEQRKQQSVLCRVPRHDEIFVGGPRLAPAGPRRPDSRDKGS